MVRDQTRESVEDYLVKHDLNALLVQGLHDTYAAQPDNPLMFLATWLRSHNVNRPDVVLPETN